MTLKEIDNSRWTVCCLLLRLSLKSENTIRLDSSAGPSDMLSYMSPAGSVTFFTISPVSWKAGITGIPVLQEIAPTWQIICGIQCHLLGSIDLSLRTLFFAGEATSSLFFFETDIPDFSWRAFVAQFPQALILWTVLYWSLHEYLLIQKRSLHSSEMILNLQKKLCFLHIHVHLQLCSLYPAS